jgi:opacity protein-like surface antigen
MKIRSILLLAALLGLSCGACAYAQVVEPTPTPDPHSYTDPAMTFTAPPSAVLVARQEVPLSELGQDLQPIAEWVLHPGQEDARMITLSMEAFSGPPQQWEGQFESQTHGSQDGTLIRDKTPMTLLNGMPATFVEVAYGSGFDAKKEFAIVWADGQRGIVLAETTRLGDASADEAKEVLKQVTAVQYPLYQP